MEKTTCLRYSSQDWYPNIDGNKVSVSLVTNQPDSNGELKHCVSVWGGDDCGMELWDGDEAKVKQIYNAICNLKDVTRQELERLNLSYA